METETANNNTDIHNVQNSQAFQLLHELVSTSKLAPDKADLYK